MMGDVHINDSHPRGASALLLEHHKFIYDVIIRSASVYDVVDNKKSPGNCSPGLFGLKVM